MNNKMIWYIIGQILKLEALFLLIPLILSVAYSDGKKVVFAFLITIVALVVSGFGLSFKLPKNQKIFAKEGLIIVAFSWIMLSIFGALPFVISREIPSFIDAFFEVVSGFTTTGASILTDVESMI